MPPTIGFIPNIKCGPCLYCHGVLESKPEEFVRCEMCRGPVHISCLKSGVPPNRLLGDNFFIFTCAQCSLTDSDEVMRANMSVPQVLLLALYNLHCTRESESIDGYFHYKTHMHSFIMSKWKELFHYNEKSSYKDKKKLQSHCISGQLTHSHYFIPKKIGRGGWYRLIANLPPTQIIHGYKRGAPPGEVKDESKKLKVNDFSSRSSSSSSLSNSSSILIKEEMFDESPVENLEDSSSRSSWFTDRDAVRPLERVPTSIFQTEDDEELDVEMVKEAPVVAGSIVQVVKCEPESLPETSIKENKFPVHLPSLFTKEEKLPTFLPSLFTKEEKLPALRPSLFTHSEQSPEESSITENEEESSSLRVEPLSVYEERKLLKELDHLNATTGLNPEMYRLRRKLKLRQTKREHGLPVFNLDDEVRFLENNGRLMNNQERISSQQIDMSLPINQPSRVLDRFQVGQERCFKTAKSEPTSFKVKLVGNPLNNLDFIHSPYSLRKLKPYIFRDFSVTPLRLKLLQEIVKYPHRKETNWKAPPTYPIDYCYVTHKHIPAMNQLARQFFWPGIELSEVLQYPDFTCVVLYGHLVIGFGVVVPDTNHNEAYVSFLLVHPEWRKAGIGKFILYHLIQTCPGKDLTLHVSATNPAMIMYQQFGFKVEEFLTNFYDKYLPEESPECKHAMFLRLGR